jgi:hypothetical protein
MPRGPNGERRRTDVIGNAVHVTEMIESSLPVVRQAQAVRKADGHARRKHRRAAMVINIRAK